MTKVTGDSVIHYRKQSDSNSNTASSSANDVATI